MSLFGKAKQNKNKQKIESEDTPADLQAAESEKSSPPPSRTPIEKLAHSLGYNYVPESFVSDDEMTFREKLEDKAQAILELMKSASEQKPKLEEAPNKEELPFSSDMSLEIHVSKNGLKAYGFLFPPIGNGASLSLDALKGLIGNNGISFGINEEILQNCVDNKTFFSVFVFAEGKAAVDGIEGKINELFSRDKQILLTVDDSERIDYKSLNWLQTVHKGDVLCQITQPIPAQDGMDVRSVPIKGREPKALMLPKGKNVSENEDKTALVADVDGYLVFSGGVIKVEQQLFIDGDVDGSVGNLDVIGSVKVRGNVFDGFTIKATGEILISGNVEGAVLEAGGNIKIVGGMNGSYKGKLISEGTVTSRFLENCYVSAAGEVKSDSIINSTIVSSDKVVSLTGKGMIINSTIISKKGVEAKIIGNERNLQTKITLGSDPKLSKELNELEKELTELTRKLEEYEKNIQYLMKVDSLDSKYQQLLEQLTNDYSVMKNEQSQKSDRVVAIEKELSDDACQITANQIFPPLSVTIGKLTQQFLRESSMSRIYKSEGEIIIASK